MAVSIIEIDGTSYPLGASATNVAFDNTGTGIEAGTVQGAIEALKQLPEEITKYVEMGRIDASGKFHRATAIGTADNSTGNTYSETALENSELNTGVLYIDMPNGKLYRYNPKFGRFPWDEISKISLDTGVVQGSTNAVQGGAIYNALGGKQDKINDVKEFIRTAVTELVGENGDQNPVLDDGGHVPYNLLPRLVLDGMGHTHSDVQINTSNNSKCFYCTDKKIRYYYDNGSKWVTSDPDKGIIYCDRAEKKLYIWNVTQSKMEALTAGEGGLTEDEVNGLIEDAIDGYVQPGDDGRIPAALITEKDGKIPYSWMPSCFLDSIDYAQGARPTSDLVGKVLLCKDGKIRTVTLVLVISTPTYVWVEQDPSEGVLYWYENRPYRWNPSEGLLEPYHICNIAIVGADEEVPDWADLCFFRASDEGGGTVPDDPDTPGGDDPVPPQPEVQTIEGDDFNALLAGNDANGLAYNPSMPYELNGVVDVNDLDESAPAFEYVTNVEEAGTWGISAMGGFMYYSHEENGDVVHVRTPMRQYGELVVSHLIKMADTADTAYISFMVSGPFFEPSTNVKVWYEPSEVDVFCWTKATGKTLNKVENGQMFSFSNTEAAKEVMLVVKRKDVTFTTVAGAGAASSRVSLSGSGAANSYTTNALKTVIELAADSGLRAVPVIFSPTRVFCYGGKEVRNSGFTVAGANAVELPLPLSIGNDGRSTIEVGQGFLNITADGLDAAGNKVSSRYCPLVTEVTFDMTKFNVFYVVLKKRANIWTHAAVYDDDWGGAWEVVDGESVPRHRPGLEGTESDTLYNLYQHSVSLIDTNTYNEDMDAWIKNRVGSCVKNCYIHLERDIANPFKTLDLYIAKNGGSVEVLEFGVITYDTSLL